jgi:two-component system LytT family response regulator
VRRWQRVLRAVIVDDEILVLNLLKKMLKEINVMIIGEYTQPRKALTDILKLMPDIIFLDIEMPGINGIELAMELSDKLEQANIVFVTAYDQYAVEAFKLNALHYILKPPCMDDVKQAVMRAEKSKPLSPTVVHKKIYIRLLGTITIQDEAGTNLLLEWSTQKAEELFALFVICGENGIDKWSIIENLWSDHNISKVEHLLYTTVYRMKKVLKEAGINVVLHNRLGYYTFSIRNAWCDIYQLEKLGEQCKNGIRNEEEIMQQLFFIYRGTLFGSRDYPWGEIYKLTMQNRFEAICDNLIDIFVKKGDIQKAEEIYIKKELNT